MIYVDLRGQGRSGRPPIETCTLEQWADDVASLCDLLEIKRPVVFGHSAGGFVAMHLAIRHPGLVGGLILCDSSPTLSPIEDRRDHLPRPWHRAPDLMHWLPPAPDPPALLRRRASRPSPKR